MAQIKLSEQDRRMLDGSQGAVRQKAMEFIIRFAEVLNVQELCDVTWADLFCGAHGYLSVAGSRDFDEIFSKMSLCCADTVSLDRMHPGCICYSGVEADATETPEGMLMDQPTSELNLALLGRFAQAGVSLGGSCIPYLTGFVPLMGEHFVSCESSAVLFMNSMWGACGNGDGIQAAFCAAVTGRTPRHGLHLAINRRATDLVRLNFSPESIHEWDLLGYAMGEKLGPLTLPAITGDFKRPGALELKAFFGALACANGTEMCHIAGLTPEARTVSQAFNGNTPRRVVELNRSDLAEALARLNRHDPVEIDYVTLGCPHYHIDEIRRIAEYMRGKKVAPGVLVDLWTVGAFHHIAERSGYLQILRDAGIRVVTGSCPSSRGYPRGIRTVAYDSAKQVLSAAQETDADKYYGSVWECLDSAVSGKWEGR